MPEPETLSKAEIADSRLKDKFGIDLHAWVAHKIDRGTSWQQMAADLHDAVGMDRPLLGREGLRKWWLRQDRAA